MANRTGFLRAAALIVVALLHSGCSSGPRGDAGPYKQPAARLDLRQEAVVLLEAATQSEHAAIRANAFEALENDPARLAGVIGAGLRDENLGVRAVAAMAVGRVRLIGSIRDVEPLLHDPSSRVRASAMYALSACGREVDLTPLASMLQDDNPLVRAQAALVLGLLGEETALRMLQETARDPMPRASVAEYRLLQLQLAEARARLGDTDALHEIRAALYPSRPEDLEATALAAMIIGEIEDRGAIDQLVLLTARQDERGGLMPPEVRLAAAGSLAELGLRRGGFIGLEYARHARATVRAQAAYVLGRIGSPEGLPALADLLGDRSGQVRVSAAAAILMITEPATVTDAALGQGRNGNQFP